MKIQQIENKKCHFNINLEYEILQKLCKHLK